jgi:cell division transport system permease protein
MLRAVDYSLREAVASLWRSRRQAALAIATIAAGVFVLGLFLAIQANLHQVLARWNEAAELSAYLHDDVTAAQLAAIDEQVARSGLAASRRYVSKDEAAARFRADFPDLARTADALARNPLPASIDVRLNAAAQSAAAAVDALAATLAAAPGVADVRYDQRLLARLGAVLDGIRWIATVIVTLLALAAALTVGSVVRLAAHARRDEIEIMELVGAPLAFVRGPFIAEGMLQGGGGAMLAIAALWGTCVVGQARYGPAVAEALGVAPLAFLPFHVWATLAAAGTLLGCAGGLLAVGSLGDTPVKFSRNSVSGTVDIVQF